MSDSLAPEEKEISELDLTNVSLTSRIGLVSDLHITNENIDEVLANLETAVERFNREGLNYAVILGDLIVESEKEQDIRKLEKIQKVMTGFEGETYYTLGNHDVVTTSKIETLDSLKQDESFGSFSLNEQITGIYLDSSTPEYQDARGYIPQEQLDYLDDKLNEVDNALIFVHHPIHYYNLGSDNWFSEHPECAFAQNKFQVQEIIQKYDNVLCTFNGHTHIPNMVEYNGVNNITVGASSNMNENNTEPTGLYNIVEVSKNRVYNSRYKLDTVIDETHRNLCNLHGAKVAFGGTFDPIHDGHKSLFKTAMHMGDIVIGLTSDKFAPKTRHEKRYILPYNERKASLENVLEQLSIEYNRNYYVRELDSPDGIITESDEITHLVVSPETLSRSVNINEKRIHNGYEPLKIEVIEPKRAEDGEILSSTRICKGEIDVHGNLTPSSNGRQPID